MANFNKKNWLSVGETGANESNSVLSKENMNDLENRIFNSSLSVTFGTGKLNSTDFDRGNCYWVKIGKIVLVQVELLRSTENKAGETIIFTGLPAAKNIRYTLLNDSSGTPNPVQSRINDTNFQLWYDTSLSNITYFSTFWYEAAE